MNSVSIRCVQFTWPCNGKTRFGATQVRHIEIGSRRHCSLHECVSLRGWLQFVTLGFGDGRESRTSGLTARRCPPPSWRASQPCPSRCPSMRGKWGHTRTKSACCQRRRVMAPDRCAPRPRASRMFPSRAPRHRLRQEEVSAMRT